MNQMITRWLVLHNLRETDRRFQEVIVVTVITHAGNLTADGHTLLTPELVNGARRNTHTLARLQANLAAWRQFDRLAIYLNPKRQIGWLVVRIGRL